MSDTALEEKPQVEAPPVEAAPPPLDAPPPAEAAAPQDGAPPPEGAEPEVQSEWPDDWRERIAGKDEKLLSRLKRFASPVNVAKSYIELERKTSSGALKAALGDNPTPEELAAYRKAHDIPETPDAYGFEPPAGIELTDADKQDLAHFSEVFHGANLPKAQANKLLDAYFARRLEIESELRESAREITIERKSEMKAEYGKDYERNLNVAKQWLDTVVGSDARNEMMDIVLADGTRLGDHPQFVRTFVQAGLQFSGDDQLAVAEFSRGGAGSIEDQYKAAIELKFTDPVAYAKPDHQQKLLRLAEAKSRAAR